MLFRKRGLSEYLRNFRKRVKLEFDFEEVPNFESPKRIEAKVSKG